ncbi:MAG: GNAT family N-acetyltransferase [Bacteroidia bacterium]|nr:GNAT family N-acetyltransferase [Bacteroidia bacterium]
MTHLNHRLNPDLTDIPWDQACQLMDMVGWEKRNVMELRAAFEKSTYSYFVFDDTRLVGFGRTVDDSQYYALIVDVVVHPDYQGKGLGTRIVNSLKDALDDYLFTTLTAARGKHGFYKKIGWQQQSSAFIWPRNESQIEDHCFTEDGPE